MKSEIKVVNMKTVDDVKIVRSAIASKEGVIACEISKEKSLVSLVYDNYFLELDDIIDAIENLGYTVL